MFVSLSDKFFLNIQNIYRPYGIQNSCLVLFPQQFPIGIFNFRSLWCGPPCLRQGIISSYERNRSSFIPVRFGVQKIIYPYAIRSFIPALNSWEDWLLAFFAQFWAWPKFILTDPVSHQSADTQFVLARVIPH